MRPRNVNHTVLALARRGGAAKTLLTAALLAVAALAPFSTSWHAASLQHVRCAEHGELTHVAVGDGVVATSDAKAVADASRSTLTGRNAGTPAGHEHCEVAFLVQGGGHAPAARTAPRIAPPVSVRPPAATDAPALARAALLAAAPKTSPPIA